MHSAASAIAATAGCGGCGGAAEGAGASADTDGQYDPGEGGRIWPSQNPLRAAADELH